MLMNQSEKNAFKEIIKKIYCFARELSDSNESIHYEVGHLLIDNLILKICMFVANDKNDINNIFKTKKGKLTTKTKDFPDLYKDILMNHYPNVPDYDNEVNARHFDRNFFSHSDQSLALNIRKEFVVLYVKIAEKIMEITNIIPKIASIKCPKHLHYDTSFTIEKRSIQKETDKWQKLLHRFAKKDTHNLGIELRNLIQKQIGESKFLTVMAMATSRRRDVYHNDDWAIFLLSSVSGVHIYITRESDNKSFHYSKPDENLDILKDFLQYLKERCRLNGMELN